MASQRQPINLHMDMGARNDGASAGHVSHVLLAEFDIDRGSSLSHQYPQPTGTDEQYVIERGNLSGLTLSSLLAEVMLPDGAHLRAEDWTIFMLNQRPSESTETPEVNRPPLLYVLNLVRTKHDKEVRRGALVKAMAICTPHQYIQIYKPLLLLALEEYFQRPGIETLASLYTAVNSMDLSAMPRLSNNERLILRFSEAKDLFEEKFSTEDSNGIMTPMEYGIKELSLNNGKKSSQDLKDSHRSTFVDLSTARKDPPAAKRTKDTHFFESRVTYNGIKLPIKIPMSMYPEEVGDFSLIKLITTFSTPTSVSPHPYHPHLDTNGSLTHPIILMMNALLTEKRVVFLGHGHPSGEVANYVLAACALGSGSGGVLLGINQRAYPYTNLVNVDNLLEVPGFVAGVTNPTFEDHPTWWDVLCNIDTGKILISKDLQATSSSDSGPIDGPPLTAKGEPPARIDSSDNIFMDEVMQAIQAHYGETAIRAKFEEYLQRFTRLAALHEQDRYGETHIGLTSDNTEFGYVGTGIVFPDEETRRKELAASAGRIEAWRNTSSYRTYVQDFQRQLDARQIKGIDVYHFLSRLRVSRRMSQNDSAEIYQLLMENVTTDEQVLELLSFMPQNSGGLFPIGMGLFHPDAITRSHVVKLFDRLSQHKTGFKFLQNLNQFQKLSYARLKTAEENAERQDLYLEP